MLEGSVRRCRPDVRQGYDERRYQRRVVSTLTRRAHVLGYTLVKKPDLPDGQFTGVKEFVKELLGRRND